MDISGVASGVNAQSNKAATGLADNFETFLTLLTTQLKNQDPLEPWTQTSSLPSLSSSPALSSRLPPTSILRTWSRLYRQARPMPLSAILARKSRRRLYDAPCRWRGKLELPAPAAIRTDHTDRDQRAWHPGLHDKRRDADGTHEFTGMVATSTATRSRWILQSAGQGRWIPSAIK